MLLLLFFIFSHTKRKTERGNLFGKSLSSVELILGGD